MLPMCSEEIPKDDAEEEEEDDIQSYFGTNLYLSDVNSLQFFVYV